MTADAAKQAQGINSQFLIRPEITKVGTVGKRSANQVPIEKQASRLDSHFGKSKWRLNKSVTATKRSRAEP
jgi:hypothetical protein